MTDSLTPPNLSDHDTDGSHAAVNQSPIQPGNDTAPDPFDPARLRLSQDFAAMAGVRKVLTVVPCRKPHRHEFVRVRPGEDWRLETGMFEDKVNRDVYLVAPAL